MSQIVLCRARGGSDAQVIVGYDPPWDAFSLFIERGGQPTFADGYDELEDLAAAAATQDIVLHHAVLAQLERDRRTQSECRRDWSSDWAQVVGATDVVVRVMERVLVPAA